MRKSILPILLGGALALPAVALAGGLRPAVYGTVGKMRLVQSVPVTTAAAPIARAVPRHPTPTQTIAMPTIAMPTIATPMIAVPAAFAPFAAMPFAAMPVATLPVAALPVATLPVAALPFAALPVAFAPPPGLMLARVTAIARVMQAQFRQMNRLMSGLEAAAAPGGACSETIIARPGPHGTMQVLIHGQGAGCGHLPGMTAMPHGAPASPSHGVTIGHRHFLPSDRLPPPSKTHFASYLTTPATPHQVKF